MGISQSRAERRRDEELARREHEAAELRIYLDVVKRRLMRACLEAQERDEPYATELPEIKKVKKTKKKKSKRINLSRCVVCMDRFPTVCQVPCGHFTTCLRCLRAMKKRNVLVTCGTCREPVERAIRLYT